MLQSPSPAPRSRRSRSWRRLAAVVSGLLAATSAQAQLNATLGVSADFGQDSNVFDVPKGSTLPPPATGTNRASSIQTYIAELKPSYEWSREKLELDFGARDIRYTQFQSLNHTEYSTKGNLTWGSGSLLDGAIGADRERRMVRFTDVQTSELLIETDTSATASLNLQLVRRWRLEFDALAHTDDSPRPGAPDLRLREAAGQGAIKYSVPGDMTAGLAVQYLGGNYTGLAAGSSADPSGAPIDYHQVRAQFVVERNTSKTDLFHAAIGYTRRDLSTPNSNIAAVTGEARYQRDLTGKTQLEIGAFRESNAYITTTSAELDTGARLGLQWHATGKISVRADQDWTHAVFPGWQLTQPLTGAVQPAERRDTHYQTSLSLRYEPTLHLSIRPYGRWQNRNSNIDGYGYSSTLYGVEVRGEIP